MYFLEISSVIFVMIRIGRNKLYINHVLLGNHLFRRVRQTFLEELHMLFDKFINMEEAN